MQEKNESNQKGPGLSWSAPQTQQKPSVLQQKPMSAPMPQNNSAAKYAGMIVVGIIAGVVLAWGWSSWKSSPTDTASNTAATSTSSTKTSSNSGLGIDTTTLPAMGSSATLTLTSPQPAGTSVAVTKVVVSAPTWIVIYENNNGGPGNALGAGLFFPESKSGTVELLRATLPGKTYLAVKQLDNGDRKFSLKDDTFVSEGGEVQWVSFETK